ncbi:unnamed protein product, partial [Ilex paraguariensis]
RTQPSDFITSPSRFSRRINQRKLLQLTRCGFLRVKTTNKTPPSHSEQIPLASAIAKGNLSPWTSSLGRSPFLGEVQTSPSSLSSLSIKKIKEWVVEEKEVLDTTLTMEAPYLNPRYNYGRCEEQSSIAFMSRFQSLTRESAVIEEQSTKEGIDSRYPKEILR